VRKQLYTANDDRQFFDRITDQLRDVEARLEAARAALQHLELALLNVACDDPGTPIGAQLILPLLQVRRVGWGPADRLRQDLHHTRNHHHLLDFDLKSMQRPPMVCALNNVKQ
jgi:hypothetical protein